jgi:hypothetical protein
VDIWSLGCVFSEAAVWVVHGQDRLQAYRRMREDETKQIYDFKDVGCFHDGEMVLQCVGIMHEEVFDNVRQSDHVTKSVVKKMIAEMLDEVDGRPFVKQLWLKSQNVLKDAEKKLKSSKGTQPEPDPFAQGDRSQTFGQPRGRVPPVVPPGIPKSESDRFAPNGVLRPRSPDARPKRERPATTNESREDTPSPQSNVDDPYETPDEMSHGLSSPPTSPQDAYASRFSRHGRGNSTDNSNHGHHGRHGRGNSNDNSHRPAFPEQLNEADDQLWNKSPTPDSRARKRDSTMHGGYGADHAQVSNFPETMSGLSMVNYNQPPSKQHPAEVPTAPQFESDSSPPQIGQNRTAAALLSSPPAKKQMPHHLSVAEASQWILNKKHRHASGGLENKVYLNELKQRDHVR